MAFAARFWFPAYAVACVLGACSGKTVEGPANTTPQAGSGAETTEGGAETTTARGGAGVTAPQGGAGGSKTPGGSGGGNAVGGSHGGNAAGGSEGGNAAGGAGGTKPMGGSAGATVSGSGGGAWAGGVPPGGACVTTSNCRAASGAFCKANVCTCPLDKSDMCGVGSATVCTLKTGDPDNCGTCGTKCDVGAACVAGKCGSQPTELATAQGCGGGVRLAIHATSLYWTEMMTGKVRTMPLGGGAITDVATGQLSPTQIAVDDQGVYWVNQGDGSAASSKLLKKPLPLATGNPLVLKAATADEKLPGLALHAGKVYYGLHNQVHQLTLNPAGEAATGDIVVGVAVNYDDPQNPVVSGEPWALAVNDTRVVWVDSPERSAVESHTLTEVTTPSDMTGYAKLGKSIGALLESGDVGIDAQFGYWANGERLERNLLAATTSDPTTITAASDSSSITAFALNATSLYAATDSGQIFTHSLTPPADPNSDAEIVPPVLVARDQSHVSSMVLSASKLYWVTGDCVIRSAGL